MTEQEARVKATEYADAVAFKSMITEYYQGYTVTPTCNFNDDEPAKEKWDVTVTDTDGNDSLVELKARSDKYSYYDTTIQDLRITGYKLDNLREESIKKECKAYVVGLYPNDDIMLRWDADGEYEETVQYTKRFEYGNTEKIKQKAYTLPFSMAEKYTVNMSDYQENFQRALNKYMRKITES